MHPEGDTVSDNFSDFYYHSCCFKLVMSIHLLILICQFWVILLMTSWSKSHFSKDRDPLIRYKSTLTKGKVQINVKQLISMSSNALGRGIISDITARI